MGMRYSLDHYVSNQSLDAPLATHPKFEEAVGQCSVCRIYQSNLPRRLSRSLPFGPRSSRPPSLRPIYFNGSKGFLCPAGNTT